jgi:hypothetical protein
MKTLTIKLVAAVVPCLLTVGGCATLTPQLDSTFGDAVNMAKARQALDKDAPIKNANRDVVGLDGIAAKEAVDRYHRSFRIPDPPANVFSIGVSSGKNTNDSSNQ